MKKNPNYFQSNLINYALPKKTFYSFEKKKYSIYSKKKKKQTFISVEFSDPRHLRTNIFNIHTIMNAMNATGIFLSFTSIIPIFPVPVELSCGCSSFACVLSVCLKKHRQRQVSFYHSWMAHSFCMAGTETTATVGGDVCIIMVYLL